MAPSVDVQQMIVPKLPGETLLQTAKVPKEVFSNMEASFTSQTYGDWRDDLINDGFAVVKGALTKEKAKVYQNEAFDWITSFGTELDIKNPETWINKNIPVQSKINTFTGYRVPHEKFMWDIRQEDGVINPFAKIYGTDKLLVSFDSLNISFPGRKDKPTRGKWQHVDQSPLKDGLQCVQGVLALSNHGPEDGGLVVYRGSHKLFREFFDTQIDKSTWDPVDRYIFTDEQLQWFIDRGCEEIKTCCEPGDLILWDSRTIHWGMEPKQTSSEIRTVVYASYSPYFFATDETLDEKKKCFETWSATTHWPHDNIIRRPPHTLLEDGTRDPRDRDEPRVKPILTEKLLKLAGVVPY
ncbi:hypothetical protein PSN45_004196 [Yamadazyma tenuis]|uniref:Phytanoyl-CoA dioxygenase n=1 Tax=Candida tenuis (strain ATCC 10573 / BCRC 21748 / CBS 615 / JCM 9827 / NBRC 10315 / NRRL Y-1498 / VKM Y-70) TaxID=590646 RepID=G3B3U7_CANTC|nr:uncharacterized protein CANTEDRAFT_113772 [Yamadazyma tenuis ATCC 10573]EGV63738.1 hypothetical protein CANTEDRAFT_113772 [Yamadazyma tenuis ATCC 10573]WEJ96654.1 hypothetical protein PSN45_004196 [Yamadazyma tenuis]